MSATQLLRILQAIPSDVKNETCAYVSEAQDMIMKENLNETTHYDSKSFGRDCDPLAVGSKEIYQLNGLTRDAHPSLFEAKGTNKYWKPKTEDAFPIDYQKRSRDSGAEELQNGSLFCLEDDKDSISSNITAENKVQNGPEHDPTVAASDLFETGKNFFADKNVLEYEHPELIVCYKEINYHVVKDICVDDGMPASRKILSDSSKDNHSGYYFPQVLDDNYNHTVDGAVNEELPISNGLEATSLQNTEFIISNQHRSKKVSNGIKLVTQGSPKLPSESSLDTATRCNLEESVETNFGAASKTSDEESFIDRALPIQGFGTRSFLRSFLNSLDGEGNTVKQLPNQQFASGKVASEGPAAASTEEWPEDDLQESILSYNSKVERKSITFNFNSLAPIVGGITNGNTELVEEVIDQKDAEADILSDSRQVEWSSKDTSSGEFPDQPLPKDRYPNDFSVRSQPQCVSSNYMDNDNALDQSLCWKDKESGDLSLNIDQLASSTSVNPLHIGNQATSSHVLQHQDMDPNNNPVVSLRRYDQGESSFSADSPTHSGPIAFSGSVSLRSEGSGTSARSFAFPVLQGEWSSSPVRMSKADGRHFRKHKCWRSGLLCCRF